MFLTKRTKLKKGCSSSKVWRKQALLIGLVFLFLGSFLTNTYAGDVTIQGRVTNRATLAGVPSATVTISTATGRILISVTTNSQGTYQIKGGFARGIYYLTASATGYISSKSTLRIPSTTSTLNFQLTKSAQNAIPQITSFSPKHLSTLITGEKLLITVKAQDADGDRLYCRYYMDGGLLKDWTTDTSFALTTATKDEGRHRIEIEVKDNKGGVARKQSDIYIYLYIPKPG